MIYFLGEYYTEIYTVNMRSIAINSLNQLKKVGLIRTHPNAVFCYGVILKADVTKRTSKIYL